MDENTPCHSRSQEELIDILRAAILFTAESIPIDSRTMDYIVKGVQNAHPDSEFKTAVLAVLHFFMSFHFHVDLTAAFVSLIPQENDCQLPDGWDGNEVIKSPAADMQKAEYYIKFFTQVFHLLISRSGNYINVNLTHIANGRVYTSEALKVTTLQEFHNNNAKYAYGKFFFDTLYRSFSNVIDRATHNQSPAVSPGGYHPPVGLYQEQQQLEYHPPAGLNQEQQQAQQQQQQAQQQQQQQLPPQQPQLP